MSMQRGRQAGGRLVRRDWQRRRGVRGCQRPPRGKHSLPDHNEARIITQDVACAGLLHAACADIQLFVPRTAACHDGAWVK